MNELEALVHLTRTPNIGSMKIRLMIEHFGSALAAANADPREIAVLPGFGPRILDSLVEAKNQALGFKEVELANRSGITIVPYTSGDYPKRLLEIPDFPIVLYVKGQLKECDKRSIAVVGTRQMSIYGGEQAEKIGRELADNGFTVISGLARGVDTAAHKGALQKGRTIAVIGSGLGNIYPPENKHLSEVIANQGVLISEFSIMTPPDRQTFPQRNRIVSGMSLGIVLVEAPKKSGAMITMEKGIAHGRKLFALPGRVDSENFEGNHYLIKNGMAQLIEGAHDVVGCYTDLFQMQPLRRSSAFLSLEAEEREFFDKLPKHELMFDDIVALTKLPVMKVNVLIMSLILKNALKEYPGKRYVKRG